MNLRNKLTGSEETVELLMKGVFRNKIHFETSDKSNYKQWYSIKCFQSSSFEAKNKCGTRAKLANSRFTAFYHAAFHLPFSATEPSDYFQTKNINLTKRNKV